MKELVVKGKTVGQGGKPLICVSLMGKSREAVVANLSKIMETDKDSTIDIIEFRGDFYEELEDLEQLEETLTIVRASMGDKILLFTIRSPKEGGENRSYQSKSIEDINRFVVENQLADMVDVELFSMHGSVIQLAKERNVKVIMSNHDFSKTPDKETIIHRLLEMQKQGADIAKIAVMPNSKKDLLTLLEATYDMKVAHSEIPIVTMSMSGMGALSRVAGEVFGSAITFAAVGEASAPGQIPVRELNEMLGYMHTYCVD